jgi:hypothetical protein
MQKIRDPILDDLVEAIRDLVKNERVCVFLHVFPQNLYLFILALLPFVVVPINMQNIDNKILKDVTTPPTKVESF